MDSHRSHVHQTSSRVEYLARNWQPTKVEHEDIKLIDEEDEDELAFESYRPFPVKRVKEPAWTDVSLEKILNIR